MNPKIRFRDRCADKVAEFGGSWTFIFIFTAFFFGWILINKFWLHWDEYPYILLNLILSCLAVFQAPFILMSQNRMSDIDRARDEEDFQIDKDNQAKLLELEKAIEEIKNEVKMKKGRKSEGNTNKTLPREAL